MGVVVSSSHIVSVSPSPSHSSPAPAWGPFHGLQFFMNFSNMGPSHGVQSFRNKVLQRGSPMGPQSCQELGPVWASHRAHPAAPAWCPPWAACGYLLHSGPPWAAGGQPASSWSSPWAAAESLLWCLEHLLLPGAPLSTSSPTLVSIELFLSQNLSPLSCCNGRYTYFVSPS